MLQYKTNFGSNWLLKSDFDKSLNKSTGNATLKTYLFATLAKWSSIIPSFLIAFVVLAEGGQIDDVTATENVEQFAPWAYPIAYKKGNIRRYGSDLYRCNQDHTSQADWTPAAAASLWSKIGDPTEEWPEWSQPVGAHDAYNAGAKVSHNGKHWTSDVASNVWEPGVYGWTEVTA